MVNATQAKLPKWPFFLSDALLLGLAYLIYWQSNTPMNGWDTFFCVLSVSLAALLGVTPWLLEYRAAAKLLEADRLTSAVLQIQNLEIITRQISSATASWQTVQDQCTRTVEAAREVAEGITAEARAFKEFLKKAHDTEKQHLRLEVDKLRRAEGDWVQILIRMLDHVYALYQAAVQSGQGNLVEQIGHFQNACRDVARRVGLVPFVGVAGEVFDPKVHQIADSTVSPPPGARIIETLAPGYSYQGQMVRPALVALRKQDHEISVSALYHRREQARTGGEPAAQSSPSEHPGSSTPGPARDDRAAPSKSVEAGEEAAPSELAEPEQEQFRI